MLHEKSSEREVEVKKTKLQVTEHLDPAMPKVSYRPETFQFVLFFTPG